MSIQILPINARINVKIGPVTFVCSPLTSQQQAEILAHIQQSSGVSHVDKFKQMRIALKYSLKDIKGVEMFGKAYKLKFDDNGNVTDDCLEEISQLGQERKLQGVVMRWLSEGYMDPKFPGINIEFPKARQKN